MSKRDAGMNSGEQTRPAALEDPRWSSIDHEDLREITRLLVERLGPTLTAFLAGCPDRQLPQRWAQGTGPGPDTAAGALLLAAHETWVLLAEHESDDVVRTWFIGSNPRLNDAQPAAALREGRVDAVLAAARSFAEGTDGY